MKWVSNFWKYKTLWKIILIFNWVRSHIDANNVHITEAKDVMLFFLPSNTTHHLQTFDIDIYVPFRNFWDKEVINY